MELKDQGIDIILFILLYFINEVNYFLNIIFGPNDEVFTWKDM
jgi:hypothetical protein